MKKTLMALTVASVAANSALAVDLDDPTSIGKTIYASEITITGTGVEVGNTEAITNELGFTITPTAPRFIRYDLSTGASFVGNPVLTVPGSSGIVVSAGGAGESWVLFEVASTGVIANTTVASLTGALATPNFGVIGTTTAQYQMFEFGAGGGNGLLASAGPGIYTAFSPAHEVGTTTTNNAVAVESTLEIEVALDSKKFVGGAVTTSLGNFYSADSPIGPVALDGVTVLGVTGVLASHTVEVDGDFSAAKAVTLVGSTSTSGCATSPVLATGTINTAMDQVVFAPTPVGPVGSLSTTTGLDRTVLTSGQVCLTVDGTSIISESDYSAVYKPVAATGYTVSDVSFALNSLSNTGTTIDLNLQLTPSGEGGVYKNYFRVTNTSNNTGRVFMYLINDNGEASAVIDMEDVYSDGVNTVVGQGSSRQFDIDAVYAAVQAADPTFSIGDAPRKKLRTIITGEFGSMDVQTYTVSTDETTFSTF